jgi:hypothetical protein
MNERDNTWRRHANEVEASDLVRMALAAALAEAYRAVPLEPVPEELLQVLRKIEAKEHEEL